LPKTFILSTFVLLASSFFLFKAKISLKYDKLNNVSLFTLLSFILGSTFIGLQLIGWVALSKQGFNFSGSNVVISYVYFISGVHLIHLVVGLFYLGSMSFKSYKASKDPVDELLFSTNPSIKFLYKQVSLYWHYLDMVWLVLFLFFLFTL
jgi:cytochrome c oxidase subunit 3